MGIQLGLLLLAVIDLLSKRVIASVQATRQCTGKSISTMPLKDHTENVNEISNLGDTLHELCVKA
jgi:hypothetical protein